MVQYKHNLIILWRKNTVSIFRMCVCVFFLIIVSSKTQKEETKLQEEIRRLKQDKQALELDLGQAKKERDLAKVQITSTSSKTPLFS